MKRNGITIVILTRDFAPMLDLALFHLRRALNALPEGASDHIIVVDNASRHPMPWEQFLDYGVEWIRFDEHVSFSHGCNIGMKRRPNDYYLMLNNDVILHQNALRHMLACFEDNPDLGICGLRLLFPDGTIQHCGIRFGPPDLGPYHVFRKEPATRVGRETVAFQAVTGACMLLKHALVEQTGGFDESFPFAWEDTDLCLRARQLGWHIACCNSVDSIHFESMTPGRLEMDPPSRDLFYQRWAGRWMIDG
jgi:GT2 family glycosyltransferase